MVRRPSTTWTWPTTESFRGERAVLGLIYVPFAEERYGRRRCHNLTTHRSGLCWLHRHPAMADDERQRP